MFYQGSQPLQAPSQLSPEPRLNQAMRGWPRLNLNDPVNAGLVGYWSMDGGRIAGTTLADLSGKGNNGTLVNGPTLVNGLFGQALSFITANTTYVECGSNVPLDSNNWTIVTWINFTSLSVNQRAVAYYGNGPTLYANGAALTMVHYGTIDFNMGFSVSVGAWYCVACTRAGSTITAYVNGIQTAQNTSFSVSYTADTSVQIGKSPDFGDPASALIQMVRLYNRAISAAEYQRIYSDTSGNFGLITPTRRMVASVAAPASTPYFPVFLGGGGLIAMRAARMFHKNKAPTRRQFLTLSDNPMEPPRNDNDA